MIIQNPILTGSVALNGLNLTATNLATTSSNSFTSDQSITGSLGISANTTIAGTLTVTGSIVGLATSASYVLNAVSSSKAVSASYSDTASFANSFNVAGNLTASNAVLSGTLTAQTLVVQTITSSIVYSSGSNNFGNQLANTQTFTGSVNITGSQTIYGNVGIGTTNPSQQFTLGIGSNTTLRTYTTDSQAVMSFYTTNDASLPRYLDIAAVATGDGSSLGGSNIRFLTQTISATPLATERMRITSAGSVGIGITNPTRPLQINAAADTRIVITDSNVSTTAGLYIRQFGSASAIVNNSNGTFQLATNDTYFLTANASGQVGIGTTQPSYTLDVTGTGRFTGDFYLTGTDAKIWGGTSAGRLILANSTSTTYGIFYGATNATPNVTTFVNNAALTLTLNANNTATFSGALSGTSATFSSTISAGIITGDSNSTGAPSIVAKVGSGGNNGTFGFGNSSDYRIRGGSDYTAIIFDTAGSERMRIKNTQIIIGSTSNNAEGRLNVSGDSAGNSNDVRLEFSTAQTYGYFQCANRVNVASKRLYIDSADLYINYLGTGTVYSNGSVLTNTNPSDSRLKENITDIAFGLNEILQLRPVEYNWINDKSNQGKQYGFVAQEVQSIIPSLVKEFTIPESELEGTEEMIRLGLEKDGIYVGLVKAIQELKAEIEELKNK